MTWPQYRRRQVEVDNQIISLTKLSAELVLCLLLRKGIVPNGDLIEFLYPDPDKEPEWAENGLRKLIFLTRNRGVPIIAHRGQGFEI